MAPRSSAVSRATDTVSANKPRRRSCGCRASSDGAVATTHTLHARCVAAAHCAARAARVVSAPAPDPEPAGARHPEHGHTVAHTNDTRVTLATVRLPTVHPTATWATGARRRGETIPSTTQGPRPPATIHANASWASRRASAHSRACLVIRSSRWSASTHACTSAGEPAWGPSIARGVSRWSRSSTTTAGAHRCASANAPASAALTSAMRWPDRAPQSTHTCDRGGGRGDQGSGMGVCREAGGTRRRNQHAVHRLQGGMSCMGGCVCATATGVETQTLRHPMKATYRVCRNVPVQAQALAQSTRKGGLPSALRPHHQQPTGGHSVLRAWCFPGATRNPRKRQQSQPQGGGRVTLVSSHGGGREPHNNREKHRDSVNNADSVKTTREKSPIVPKAVQ
jgi:hypothetical protein